MQISIKTTLNGLSFYYAKKEVIIINNIYGVIYCVTNKINNKKYIGQTTRELKRRKNEHITQADNGSDLAIHQAIRKYGEGNFEWSIIDQAYNQEELDNKEIYWIDFYNTYYEDGYNMALGGQFNLSDNPDEMSEMRGGREFLIFDTDGNFIKETISQTEFADEIGVSPKTVNHVLMERKSSTKGYILIFKDEFSEKKLKEKIKQIKDRHKPFAVFDLDWDLVGIWDNKVHCAEEIKYSRRLIQKQLNQNEGKKRPKKYRLYYLNDVPSKYKYKIKDVI